MRRHFGTARRRSGEWLYFLLASESRQLGVRRVHLLVGRRLLSGGADSNLVAGARNSGMSAMFQSCDGHSSRSSE